MKVQDLENWPPNVGEFFETSPAIPHPELSIVTSVLSARDNSIIFSCEFGDHNYPCFFLTQE
jgi:hypothetical protein